MNVLKVESDYIYGGDDGPSFMEISLYKPTYGHFLWIPYVKSWGERIIDLQKNAVKINYIADHILSGGEVIYKHGFNSNRYWAGDYMDKHIQQIQEKVAEIIKQNYAPAKSN